MTGHTHPRRWALRPAALAATVMITVALGAPPAGAGKGADSKPTVTTQVVGKAAPDECWIPPEHPDTASEYGQYDTPPDTAGQCPAGSVPKVNQAYVWGLTRTARHLWFGTVANTQCLVMGSYLGVTDPMWNATSVCEFGESPTVALGVPPALGDWRPPHLYRYDMQATQQPVDLATLQVNAPYAGPINGLLGQTVGIRSATSVDDPFEPGRRIVIFAGPSLVAGPGSLTMFAFRDDGTFLQAGLVSGYNDIRRWVSTGGSAYTGVGRTDGTGAVLKWAPTPAAGEVRANYLDFVEVADLPSDVAELTLAGNRLVAGTWPSGTSQASVWVSPAGVAIADLTTAHAWTRVWQATDYDPDVTTAFTYGTGAMAYYGGFVYWGTMHVPGVAFLAAEGAHPSTSPQAALANFVGSYRAISLFRVGVSATTQGPVELLYGEEQLPAYVNGAWQMVDNAMGGVAGLYGSSGFGNQFNNYTWSMAVHGGQLYVGTMDWSYLASQAWPSIVEALGLDPATPNPLDEAAVYGADLYRFPSPKKNAQMLYENGVGNPLSYGVRNMLSVEDAATNGGTNGLYLGMANPENLATTGPGPRGGWELIRLDVVAK